MNTSTTLIHFCPLFLSSDPKHTPPQLLFQSHLFPEPGQAVRELAPLPVGISVRQTGGVLGRPPRGRQALHLVERGRDGPN
jgi:hypothetical protein